jgi:hypothetical protein
MATQHAYFVNFPRTFQDLYHPHLLKDEMPYKIVSAVCLSAMDYENFITDMRVSRDYLEGMESPHQNQEMQSCLLITKRGRSDGILVVPNAAGFVVAAALFQ